MRNVAGIQAMSKERSHKCGVAPIQDMSPLAGECVPKGVEIGPPLCRLCDGGGFPQPLTRLVLGGGEASASLADTLGKRLDIKCELGDPLRNYESVSQESRRPQWDVAAGLALREMSDQK